MNVLITGGAGYIGSELVGELLSLSDDVYVTVYDSMMYDRSSLLRYASFSRFKFVRDDVRNYGSLDSEISKNDVIISLAALVGFPLCDMNPKNAEDVNFRAVEHIARAKSSDQILMYPCTNSGYGSRSSGICVETDRMEPITLYGRTKVAAEDSVMSRENAVSLRLATVFGPSTRMRVDLLVNDFVLKAVSDGRLEIFQDRFMRNYVHIHDVCRAFSHILANWSSTRNNVYNVGNDSINCDKRSLAEKVCERTGASFSVVDVGEDPDKRDYIVSSQKLYGTGFVPLYDLDVGIRQLITTYNLLGDVMPWHRNY